MDRRILAIGGLITFALVGGAVASGTQNNTVVPSYTAAPASSTDAPLATTLDTTGVGTSTATFNGVITTQGAEISYWFEYSADPLLGQILIRRTPPILLITNSDAYSVDAEADHLILIGRNIMCVSC